MLFLFLFSCSIFWTNCKSPIFFFIIIIIILKTLLLLLLNHLFQIPFSFFFKVVNNIIGYL